MNSKVRRPIRLVISGVLVCLAGCSAADHHAFRALYHLAGSGAIDCGLASFSRSDAKANACVIGASAENTPFFVRYVIRSPYATISRGLARNRSGKLFSVFINHDPNERQGDSLFSSQSSVRIVPCATNRVVLDATVSDRHLLTCEN